MMGAPAPNAAKAEGMLAVEQAKLAVSCSSLVQHPLHAHAALYALAVPHCCQPGVPCLALPVVLLCSCLILGVQSIAPADLHQKTSVSCAYTGLKLVEPSVPSLLLLLPNLVQDVPSQVAVPLTLSDAEADSNRPTLMREVASTPHKDCHVSDGN